MRRTEELIKSARFVLDELEASLAKLEASGDEERWQSAESRIITALTGLAIVTIKLDNNWSFDLP